MRSLTKSGVFLAALSWLHILLICAGLYLLTVLTYDMEAAGVSLPHTAKDPLELLIESLWLIIPLALGWVFVRATRSLVVYLLCSCAVCALLSGLTHSVLTTALSAFLLAARCYTRIRKGKLARMLAETPGEAGAQLAPELWEIPTFLDRPTPTHWGIFVFYYVIFLLTKKTFLLKYVFYLLLADVFVCFLFGYLDSMQRFIRENKRIANLPVHSIQKVGRILLLVSVILLGLIVLPSALYGREPLAELHIRRRTVEITPSTEMPEMMPDILSPADFGMTEAPSEPPAWLTALSSVLFYLGAVVAAAALLAGIYRICRNALSYFAQDEEDEILFLGAEETSGVHADRRLLREKRERRSSPNWKIRRLYKKTIRNAMKKNAAKGKAEAGQKLPAGGAPAGQRSPAGETGIPTEQKFPAGETRIPAGQKFPAESMSPAGWETPSELETKAQLVRDASTDKLHTLYEKARYSREGCTDEEAEALR